MNNTLAQLQQETVTKPVLSKAARLYLFLLKKERQIKFSKPSSNIQELFELGFVVISKERFLCLTCRGVEFIKQEFGE